MIETKQYTVVDMQKMSREMKDACLAYFHGYANDGFYNPDIWCRLADQPNFSVKYVDKPHSTIFYPIPLHYRFPSGFC